MSKKRSGFLVVWKTKKPKGFEGFEVDFSQGNIYLDDATPSKILREKGAGREYLAALDRKAATATESSEI